MEIFDELYRDMSMPRYYGYSYPSDHPFDIRWMLEDYMYYKHGYSPELSGIHELINKSHNDLGDLIIAGYMLKQLKENEDKNIRYGFKWEFKI